jgi:HD-GYP domain-containing protein (c-di-GMP phosphodiesterase class II)
MKNPEAYDQQHALSVASMAVALGSTLGIGEETLRQLALGALLQDLGKARIPDDILHKPDRLTAYETRWMRRHVFESQLILEDTPGITDLMLDVVAHHHERLDGTGYPHALSGDQIPLHAQVAAIVDVYDALTSDRSYQQRTEPTEALRQIYGMTSHFHLDLVQAFVRTVGIYPAGSLVRLDNNYLAVVIEQNRDDLLKPRVCVMFDTRIDRYVRPYLLDLGHRLEPPSIVGFESYARWGIDPRRWHPT